MPLTEYQVAGNALNFTYVPMYGKFTGFSDFIFHYDVYLVGGVGAICTRPIAVIDPDNRKFDYEHAHRVQRRRRPPHLLQPLVRGHRRDPRLHLLEQLENPTVAADAAERGTRTPGSARSRSPTTSRRSSASASSCRSAGSTGCPSDARAR